MYVTLSHSGSGGGNGAVPELKELWWFTVLILSLGDDLPRGHRVIEYHKLKGICKSHPSPAHDPAQDTPSISP